MMMIKTNKIIVTVIVCCVIGFLIYQSPDESHWHEANLQDAITTGQDYAWNLLQGNKQQLLKISVEPAKGKVQSSDYRIVADSEITEQLSKKDFDLESLYEKHELGKYEFIAPLFAEINDMELVALDRKDDFIAMTFYLKTIYGIVEIPGRGKMLFSVGVRYYKPVDTRIIGKLIRKVANAPLLRGFMAKMGTTGHWVIFDYHYNYDKRDYLKWILDQSDYLNKQYDKNIQNSLVTFKNKVLFNKCGKDIETDARENLNLLYKWGFDAMKKQIEYVEGSVTKKE